MALERKQIVRKITGKKLFFLLKIIITALILYFLFRKIDLKLVFNNFLHLKLDVLIILLTTALYKIYLQLKNWEDFLQINPDYKSDQSEILRSLLVGYSLRFLVPGGYGIVGKVFFVNNSKKATLVSVGLEKFIQIWTALLFASVSAIFYFQSIDLIIKLIFFALILISPGLIILISSLIRHKNIRSYLKNYNKTVLKIVFRQIQFIFLTLLQFFFVLGNFVRIGIITVLVSIPLVLSANLIPFSYAGLGFKETFAVEVLERYQISPEIAVTSTLIIFFINTLLPALAGLYVILRKKGYYS